MQILATSTVVDAVLTSIDTVQSQATWLMTTAGGVIVSIAIMAGLWELAVRWSNAAASSGEVKYEDVSPEYEWHEGEQHGPWGPDLSDPDDIRNYPSDPYEGEFSTGDRDRES